MRICWSCLIAFVLFAPGRVDADVWDVQTNGDNASATTQNQLVHGTRQIHDLGGLSGPPAAADQDWYWITVPAYSSFEVVLDGASGDINPQLSRVALDGVTVLLSSVGIGVGHSRRLAFTNASGSAANYFIFVGNAACGVTCGADDQYTISSRETTVSVARFNNAGSQITVLFSQNASDIPINASFFYWSPSGTLLHTGTLAGFPARNLNILNTSSVVALQGVGGHITIAHGAPYGAPNVKSVALEPSTGFSFDTAGACRGL